MGIMTAAIEPSKVHAHWTPIPSNICVENRGKPAAMDERNMMLAATAEAVLMALSARGRTKGGLDVEDTHIDR